MKNTLLLLLLSLIIGCTKPDQSNTSNELLFNKSKIQVSRRDIADDSIKVKEYIQRYNILKEGIGHLKGKNQETSSIELNWDLHYYVKSGLKRYLIVPFTSLDGITEIDLFDNETSFLKYSIAFEFDENSNGIKKSAFLSQQMNFPGNPFGNGFNNSTISVFTNCITKKIDAIFIQDSVGKEGLIEVSSENLTSGCNSYVIHNVSLNCTVNPELPTDDPLHTVCTHVVTTRTVLICISTPPVSTGGGGNWFPPSGGSGSPTIIELPQFQTSKNKLCPDSRYSFGRIGAADALTATIVGLSVYFIRENGESFSIPPFEACVTIPPNRSQHPATSYQASEILNDAWNQAVRDLTDELNAGLIGMGDITLRSRLKHLINLNLQASNPGSSFTTRRCSGGRGTTIPTSKPKYCVV